jgi:hypothetical protein
MSETAAGQTDKLNTVKPQFYVFVGTIQNGVKSMTILMGIWLYLGRMLNHLQATASRHQFVYPVEYSYLSRSWYVVLLYILLPSA